MEHVPKEIHFVRLELVQEIREDEEIGILESKEMGI
jgi:hypothetical protein